jgi:hypothetical protein
MQNVVEILTDYEARKRMGKTKNVVTEQRRDESHPNTRITHRRSHCRHCLLLLSYLVLQQLQTLTHKKQQLQNSLLHSTFWLLAPARGQHVTNSGSVTIMPAPAAPAAAVPSKPALQRLRPYAVHTLKGRIAAMHTRTVTSLQCTSSKWRWPENNVYREEYCLPGCDAT